MKKIVVLLLILFSVSQDASAKNLNHFDVIVERVCSWRDAWQNKDINRYMSFYSPRFKSGEFDCEGWETYKTMLFQKPEAVSVDILEPCIKKVKQNVIISFLQRYRSPHHSDTGRKTMTWKKENGYWRIFAEEWEPLPGLTSDSKDPQSCSSSTGVEITDITATTMDPSEKTERILLKSNPFLAPKVTAIPGEKPKIIIEYRKISRWKGPLSIHTKGTMIYDIHTYLHTGCKKMRIAVYLNPTMLYGVRKFHYRTKNLFCLEIFWQGMNENTGVAIKR